MSVIEYYYIVVTAKNDLVQHTFSKSGGKMSSIKYDLSDFSNLKYTSAGYIGNTNAKAFATLLDKDKVYWVILLNPTSSKPIKQIKLDFSKYATDI